MSTTPLQWLFPASIAPSPTSSQNWTRGNERSSIGENTFSYNLLLHLNNVSGSFPQSSAAVHITNIDSILLCQAEEDPGEEKAAQGKDGTGDCRPAG